MLISREQLKVAVCASTDSSRPILQYVFAETLSKKKGGGQRTWATDSYVLGCVTTRKPVDDKEFPALEGMKIDPNVATGCFKAEHVAELEKVSGNKMALTALQGIRLGKNYVVASDLSRYVVAKSNDVTGQPPNWEQIIPEKPKTSIAIDPKKLEQVLKVFKGCSQITIEVGEKLDPVLIRSEEADVEKLALVMPLRI